VNEDKLKEETARRERRLADFQADAKNAWEQMGTSQLFEEIEERLLGCIDPLCLSCANTNVLVRVLRERFETEIDKALKHDMNC